MFIRTFGWGKLKKHIHDIAFWFSSPYPACFMRAHSEKRSTSYIDVSGGNWEHTFATCLFQTLSWEQGNWHVPIFSSSTSFITMTFKFTAMWDSNASCNDSESPSDILSLSSFRYLTVYKAPSVLKTHLLFSLLLLQTPSTNANGSSEPQSIRKHLDVQGPCKTSLT